MRCVRCLADTAAVSAQAPDGSGAWEKRDPFFQLDAVDLDELDSPLPIPPLGS
jgi:hypothetical protein